MDSEKQLLDHEERIRRLEASDIEQKLRLSNIEKSQTEIKLMITEGNNKLLDNLINSNKQKDEIKFYNTKQFWALAATVITTIILYLTR